METFIYGSLNKKIKEARNITQEKVTESVNEYLNENPPTTGATTEQVEQITTNTKDISELKSDLTHSKEAIYELNEKKITKFYANNLGETILSDSDNSHVTDMLIYGKSLQNGTATPDNPIEIQSVVNPVVSFSDGTNEQTASLPYTLNAIPVSKGGNVTIDGRMYIADYVDVENKRIVRKTQCDLINSFNYFSAYGSNGYKRLSFFTTKINVYQSKAFCNIFGEYKYSWNEEDEYFYININDKSGYVFTQKLASLEEANERLNSIGGMKLLYACDEYYEQLTDEEVQAFKDLVTYYPNTNVFVASDQLDGYATFNYPVSLKNGWNYVKEQLGDTRDYIYDMDLQSAEAYVNSEYAVALAELEV